MTCLASFKARASGRGDGRVFSGPHCIAWALAGLLAGLMSPLAHAYEVRLYAAPPLHELLTGHLDLFRYRNRDDINEDQLNFMITTAAEQVAKLASTEGFFSPISVVETHREGDTTVIRVTVNSGPRTLISNVNINVTGAATTQSPAQVEQVRQKWSLTAGAPFRQSQWAQAKQDGLEVLQQRRYAAARVADSQARVLADEQEAALSVEYDSGPQFTLGAPQIRGTQRYPERIVHHLNPLRIGEEYSVERLFEFQRQLLKTPYFSNAVVNIDPDPAHAQLAPVQVHVAEYPTQRLRGGAGLTTDTGASLDGLYSHNDLFGRAWVFESQAVLEQQRQFGSLQLALPPNRHAFVDSVHGSAERTTLEGLDLRSVRLGLRRTRDRESRDISYSLEYYRDRLEQLDGSLLPRDTIVRAGTHQALVASIGLTRRRVDDLVFPRQGRIVSVQAGVALKGLLTDQSFVRLYGQLLQYLPVGRRDLVLLRTELGGVLSRNGSGNAAIPATLLFRAGGTDSVRGYGFQSIGNESGGTVYPTRYLATGSAEYQHWLAERWGAAVFYDVGMAADRWQGKSVFHALGVGARWRSPVGTIRVDLAYGFQENRLRPHLSLGVAF